MSVRAIEDNWSSCTACPLARTRCQYVRGSRWILKPRDNAPLILFVGDMPGPQEDRDGEAFVGPAGDLLRKEYLTPADVRFAFLDHAVACYAGRIRQPTEDELGACSPRLGELANALKPKGIVAVGPAAERALSAEWARAYPFTSVVHPSYILRKGWPSPTTRKMVNAQVTKLKRFVKLISAPPPEPLESPQEHVCDFQERGAWANPSTGVVAPLRACLCGMAEAPPRVRATRTRRNEDPAPADDYHGEPDQELEAEDYSNEPDQLTFEVTIRRTS